jgi:Flp pilus assembly protein TadG
MDTTPHAGERGGGVGVEMALIWIAMLALVAAATQVALVFYAGQLALTAAQDGVHTGATQTAAAQAPAAQARAALDPAAQGRAQDAARDAAQGFLGRASGTVFTPAEVTVSVEPGGGVLRVQVRGQALSLIPGTKLTVDKSAVAALEQVAP